MYKAMLRAIAAITAIVLYGCASVPGPIQISPDTYMISREDHRGIFGSLSSLKAEVINEANQFAAGQGKIAIPISSQEKPLGGTGQWASFEYQFRVVNKDDPEAQRTALLPRPDIVIAKSEKHVTEEAPSRPPPLTVLETAEVGIASSVENADIYIDGNFVGNAPLPNYRLTSGNHTIEVRAAGYRIWSRELTVTANATSRVVAQLEKLP